MNVAEWRAAGITKAIIRASTEDAAKVSIAKQQIETCLAGGLNLDVYLWLDFLDDDPPEEQMARVLENYGQYPIGRYWLDLEERSPYTAATTIDWILRALDTLYPQPRGVYTRRSWWASNTGDSTAGMPPDVPLWDSDPDGVADLLPFAGYGPWTKRAIKQFAFDVNLGGKVVDLNIVGRES